MSFSLKSHPTLSILESFIGLPIKEYLEKAFEMPFEDEVFHGYLIIYSTLPKPLRPYFSYLYGNCIKKQKYLFVQDLLFQMHRQLIDSKKLCSLDLLRIVSQHIEYEQIQKLVSEIDNLLALIIHIHEYFDEGSYKLFKVLQAFDDDMLELLQGLQNRIFDLSLLKTLTNMHIKAVIKHLKQDFHEKVKCIYEALKTYETSLDIDLIEFKKFETFCNVFGLYEQSFASPEFGARDKLGMYEWSKLIDEQSAYRASSDAKMFMRFIREFHDKQFLKQNLAKLVITLPTCNKHLRHLPFLCEYIDSLKAFEKTANLSTQKNPILIFDQSDEEIFLDNRRYIDSLDYPCLHISKEQCLTIGKMLDIDQLFCLESKHFGYGGARNAVTILGPIIQKFYNDSPKFDLNQLTEDDACRLFNELFDPSSPLGQSRIFMGDDDLMMPKSDLWINLFDHNEGITHIKKPQYGRDPNRFLTPSVAFVKDWQYLPCAGAVTPPQKLYLPHAYGGEEIDIVISGVNSMLSVPAVHLCSARLPNRLNPIKAERIALYPSYMKLELSYRLLHKTLYRPIAYIDTYEDFYAVGNALEYEIKTKRFWEHLSSTMQELFEDYGHYFIEKDLMLSFIERALSYYKEYSDFNDRSDLRNKLCQLKQEMHIDEELTPHTYATYHLVKLLGTAHYYDLVKPIMKVYKKNFF